MLACLWPPNNPSSLIKPERHWSDGRRSNNDAPPPEDLAGDTLPTTKPGHRKFPVSPPPVEFLFRPIWTKSIPILRNNVTQFPETSRKKKPLKKHSEGLRSSPFTEQRPVVLIVYSRISHPFQRIPFWSPAHRYRGGWRPSWPSTSKSFRNLHFLDCSVCVCVCVCVCGLFVWSSLFPPGHSGRNQTSCCPAFFCLGTPDTSPGCDGVKD